VKAKEVRNLNDEQLVDKVREFREELFNLRFRNATGELENTARVREARKGLARSLTIAKEREIDIDAELQRHSATR
jgi:large subunit ribosomal protein L29